MSSLSHTAPQPGAAAPRVEPGDIAVGVVIGRTSEYFDFFVYGIASVLVFPRLLFPYLPLVDGTLYSFALFALAFVARPVGTIVSMMIQRRWGRGTKLTVAMFMLGVCTVSVAFLPGYDSLGHTAVLLLALLRIGQGLALGGSWDGLPSLLALSAPEHRRGWYAMLGQLGAPTGFILASGVFALLWGNLSSADFIAWGWRYAFFVAFAINIVALFARLSLVMGEEFSELLDARELTPARITDLLRDQGSNQVIGAFAALASYALFHLITVFPLSWIQLHSEQSIVQFLLVQVAGGFVCILAIVASGRIADLFGRQLTLGALAVMIAVFSGFTPLLLGGGVWGQNAFIVLGFMLLGLSYGQSAGAATANFAPQYRYTGAALTADLAWLIGAAFAPLVALWLATHFGVASISVYLLSGAACTVTALAVNRRRAGRANAAA